jgi:hypothetical protein
MSESNQLPATAFTVETGPAFSLELSPRKAAEEVLATLTAVQEATRNHTEAVNKLLRILDRSTLLDPEETKEH